MENNLSIRAASRHYKVSARTLRFYEEAGILKSRRKPDSRYREYDGEQLSRLEVILLLRELGFTIKEIAGLLDGEAKDFLDALNRKTTECGRNLLELREQSRLLQKIKTELVSNPSKSLRAADIISEMVYLSTKKMERVAMMGMMEITGKDQMCNILVGEGLIPAVMEDGGNLAKKISAMRAEFEAIGKRMPPVRIRDDIMYKDYAMRITWNDEKQWFNVFKPEDSPTDVADRACEELRKLAN
jgi:DNA-binding transcriptional MerR regulator